MKFNARTFIFIRETQGLNQKELAEKLELLPKTLSAWETEKQTPFRRNLQRAAEVLNAHVEVFRLSDSDFYKYLMQHIHPAEFPLLIRDLFSEYYRLDRDKDLNSRERILTKLAIFDRLVPLLHQGHTANLDEATEAQIANEELIRNASPYD